MVALSQAVSPSRGPTLFVIECTTGVLTGNGKLARLVQRTAEIRNAFTGRPESIVPVIACALDRAKLAKGELESAGASGIAVLCREELGELLELAQRRGTPREVLSSVTRSIPVQIPAMPRLGR